MGALLHYTENTYHLTIYAIYVNANKSKLKNTFSMSAEPIPNIVNLSYNKYSW